MTPKSKTYGLAPWWNTMKKKIRVERREGQMNQFRHQITQWKWLRWEHQKSEPGCNHCLTVWEKNKRCPFSFFCTQTLWRMHLILALALQITLDTSDGSDSRYSLLHHQSEHPLNIPQLQSSNTSHFLFTDFSPSLRNDSTLRPIAIIGYSKQPERSRCKNTAIVKNSAAEDGNATVNSRAGIRPLLSLYWNEQSGWSDRDLQHWNPLR